MAKAKKVVLPASHLEELDKLGLRTVAYLNESVRCVASDGKERDEWLPRDIIGEDGKTLIVWRRADKTYDFDGWEPWHDGMFGGKRQSIRSALAWVRRAIDVRSGRAENFLGV